MGAWECDMRTAGVLRLSFAELTAKFRRSCKVNKEDKNTEYRQTATQRSDAARRQTDTVTDRDRNVPSYSDTVRVTHPYRQTGRCRAQRDSDGNVARHSGGSLVGAVSETDN